MRSLFTCAVVCAVGLPAPSQAADIARRKTGIGASSALTSRQDLQGGVALTLRARDQLLVRVTAPYVQAVRVHPGWGAGADVLWRFGPELKNGSTKLFVRTGPGLLVGTDRYGIDSLAVLQGTAGVEVHLAAAPVTVALELRPQLVIAPYAAVDLAVGTEVSWWF